MKKIIALLLMMTMLFSSFSFSFAENADDAAKAEETVAVDEATEEADAEEDTDEAEEDDEMADMDLVPMAVELDPEVVRTMGLSAATAVAYGVDPAELVYYDHLIVGNPTEMLGDFFTNMWGNRTSDIDVRELLHGYNLVWWNGGMGAYEVDPNVVLDLVGVEEEATGNRTYTFMLQNDLQYSDGTRINAWDYAFSLLLTLSPEIAEIGADRLKNSGARAIIGSEAYMNGTTDRLAGVRVTADNTISITLDGEFLPFFFELALLSCTPYPRSEIAPGVQVRDSEEGVYLEGDFTAELLAETINGADGYRSHPKVVAGPYTLKSWDGTTAEFTKNEYFKGNPSNEIVLIDNLTYTTITNETMNAQLVSGEMELLNKVAYVDSISKGLEDMANEENAIANGNYPRSGLAYLGFACEKDTVSSEAVRQAIAWAIDRDAIMSTYTGYYGTRVDGYYGVGQWMFGLVRGTTEPPIDEEKERGPQDMTIEEETAAWEALPEEWAKLNTYGQLAIDAEPDEEIDMEAKLAEANRLLDADGWTKGEDGIREKNGVKLDLTLVYPEGNRIGEILESNAVNYLADVGIKVTLKAVPINELNAMLLEEDRQMDMFFQASNFDIVFDPSVVFNPDDEQAITRQQDRDLYRLAVEMNQTEPGDSLGYVQKWIAFEQKFNTALPVLPLYSNVYFDFYTDLLKDYDIPTNATWSQAILGAAKVFIPEYEIPMVPADENAEGEVTMDD